ncbi:DUF4350 domain-containing protein [Methylocucumis oryzae]|uniref:DUF4350 domain-containing protein n=1 Tax=Methylocucumis oryzae TaxID=1632867 RepID=A0A0F3ILF2_9GAMM|nr:DUF4350 domain-containing protein [Methylocucumis oryzae]KJV06414.1 hypothetical protein VZ94_11380 [Methylocucumis oryzae]
MKDRLVTLVSVLAALLVVLLLFAPRTHTEKPISLPTSEDSGNHGLKGLKAWLQREQVPVLSWRKPLPSLLRQAQLAENGHVLLLSMPSLEKIQHHEWLALKLWLEQGNTAIMLVSAFQQPEWDEQQDGGLEQLKHFFFKRYGLTLDTEELTGEDSSSQDDSLSASVNRLQENIHAQIPVLKTLTPDTTLFSPYKVKTLTTLAAPGLLAKKPDFSRTDGPIPVVTLLRFDDDQPAAWLIAHNNSRIVILLAADLFNNTRLASSDNALWFSSLLSHLRNESGTVIFDDYPFGLHDLYSSEQFFSDPRLYQTLTCILLLWLSYALGYSNRLAPVREKNARLTALSVVDVMAGFFARRVDAQQLSKALISHLLSTIAKRRHFATEALALDWLSQIQRGENKELHVIHQVLAGQKNLINTFSQSDCFF